MASSSIVTPTVADGPEIATDEVDERHFQGVKLFGGGTGVVNEAHVDETGSLRTSRRLFVGSGSTSIGQTSYVDHALIGAAFLLGTIPAGLYDVAVAIVSMGDFSGPGTAATDPLPDFHFGIVGVPEGTDVSFLTDGVDMSALPFAVNRFIQFVPPAAFTPNLLGLPQAAATPEFSVFLGSGDGSPTDVYGAPIANGPISTDLTAWDLAVSLALEARSTS